MMSGSSEHSTVSALLDIVFDRMATGRMDDQALETAEQVLSLLGG
jgi:hypothetical protein